MTQNAFSDVAAREGGRNWTVLISRKEPIYQRSGEIRSEFARDHGRILHSTAYRRLKHKTQVFFAPQNDHICTRIEHVNHVASVSATIAQYLGLNAELTGAIAIGHDLGHAPFGHHGEVILSEIAVEQLGYNFWHERNSLRFVDELETLADPTGYERNLNLSYAVRDGIICHCGEVDETALFPRREAIDLSEIGGPGQCAPYTWEGCVVKVSDKIAYLGRDIEDAMALRILNRNDLRELVRLVGDNLGLRLREVNNTALIHRFITDMCSSSSPDAGMCLSEESVRLMRTIREFSLNQIYQHARLNCYKEYARVVLKGIYSTLLNWYRDQNTLVEIRRHQRIYPLLTGVFADWVVKYTRIDPLLRKRRRYENAVVYDFEQEADYRKAIIDFMSGMTDNFAIRVFGQLTSF
jgi:dGTPase